LRHEEAYPSFVARIFTAAEQGRKQTAVWRGEPKSEDRLAASDAMAG
jgi:hypothetical protein